MFSFKEHPRKLIPELLRLFYTLDWVNDKIFQISCSHFFLQILDSSVYYLTKVTGTGGGITMKLGLVCWFH